MKSSSLEEQKNTQDARLEATKLTKIHTFLESIDDPNEDKYKEKLLKLDKASLDLLLEQPQREIVNVLNKSPIELNQYLIQTQIKKIENSADPDFDKLDELQNRLIAVEDNKQIQQKETIANEKAETQSRLTQVDKRLSSIEGSLSIIKNSSNTRISQIFSLIQDSKSFNK